MNDLLLKDKMRRFGDTSETLAKALGIHPSTLYMKMRTRKEGARFQEFSQSEIRQIVERYKLNAQEIAQIFFDEII